ncbi:MAG: S41 family peptidase [Ornithinibacter sp.]
MTNDTPAGAPADLFIALAALVDEHYILLDVAPEYAHRIREHADALSCSMPDIDATNAALHRLVPDRHLSLRRPTASAAGQHRGAPPAGGINRLEHLDDGVCVVAIHPVFTGPVQARAYLRAAAQLAAPAEGLVLDLRRCYGGDTNTAALIHGWLLGPEPVRIGRFEHRGRPSTDYTSDPSLGWHFRGPVRVLTSSTTFSGGEDLAYVLQSLGRARVIGEQTAGGAHPVEHFSLPGGQICQIPVARSVIDATGTNWEATGVTPDTTCSAQTALDHAIAELTTHAASPK